ncbi:MAG: HNH endonuclease [Planctomycetota bacterium]|nr:HNH endonuclease [Planctomycetota bacterium]
MRVFELESLLESLFDEVCPIHPSGQRALKPIMGGLLGSLCVDLHAPNGRRLVQNREYNRLDFSDFLDYATSPLPNQPFLQDFTDGRIEFFEGFERIPKQPAMEVPGIGKGFSILDCAISRQKVFVSTTTRFRMFEEDSPQDILLTMTFAPPRRPRYVADPLIEWDRHIIFPPVEGDPEWRFASSGVFTDHLLSEMKDKGGPGALSPDKIRQMRLAAATDNEEHGFLFEACRLTLHLPAYFDFMYDLIVTEEVPIRGIHKSHRPKITRRRRRPGPRFRLVRSIRVIRVGTGIKSEIRKWIAPKHSFAVTGHWRRLQCAHKGKDCFGHPVVGKTWVRTYARYKSLEPGDMSVSEVDPQVTINIKQTLSYAKDVIESHRRAGDIVDAEPSSATHPSKPSTEWKATERAKLNAALRFAIMKRDGFRCQICGRDASKDNSVRLQVDHIVPVARWGRTIESNLQTLCDECNRGKNDNLME